MFSFILGALAVLAVSVFFPNTFSKMVQTIRSLWVKVQENEDNLGN